MLKRMDHQGIPNPEPVRQSIHWLYSDKVDLTELRLLALASDSEQGVEFVQQSAQNHTHNLINNPDPV